MNGKELMVLFTAQETQDLLADAALLITGNREDAADIVQDVAYMLVAKQDEIIRVELPLPFLKTCVRNAARNWMKREGRKFAVDPHIMQRVFAQAEKDINILEFEMFDSIKAALSNYSPERQEAFLKYYIHGYSIDVLSIEYGVAKNTLLQQFSRMRTKLKKDRPHLFLLLVFCKYLS